MNYFRRRCGRSFYSNKRIPVEGGILDSGRELQRHTQLKAREQAGEIEHLAIHPKFVLLPGFEREGKKYQPITFELDFKYFDKQLQRWVIEDVKGRKNYRTKKLGILKSKPLILRRDYSLRVRLLLYSLPSDHIFMEVF